MIIFLSGYHFPKNEISAKNLVAILLQHVFDRYPIYSFANINNTPLPSVWQRHIEAVLTTAGKNCENLNTNSDDAISAILSAFNDEFSSTKVQLFTTPYINKTAYYESLIQIIYQIMVLTQK